MRTALLVVLLAVFGPDPLVWAQQEGAAVPTEEAQASSKGKSDTEKPAQTSTPLHEEVVVTATRYEVDSSQTPLPISSLSQADLERLRPERLVDALKTMAGVEFTGEGPFRGLPIIRGLASNRILVLVDGERLNNARESTQFAGIQPGLVDLSAVERVEVLRGPASVLYGSDAIGGVINIITKQRPFTPGPLQLDGVASYEYGTSADANRARAELNGTGEKVAFHLGASWASVGNYQSPKGEVPNSGMDQNSADGSLRLLLGQSSVLNLNVESVNTRDVGFPGYDPVTSGIDISFPRFDRDKVGLTWQAGDLFGLDTVTLRSYVQKVVKESKRNIKMGPRFFSNNTTTSNIDSTGLSGQGSLVTGSHRLTFGADFVRDRIHDETVAESSFGSSNAVAVPDSTQTGLGVFLQDEISASQRLSLVGGLRADRYSFTSSDDPRYLGEPFDVQDSAVSGNLAARYAVTPHVQLTASVGRGFRAPNLQERSYTGLVSTGDTWVVQNPNLGPETSFNIDAGFKVRYDRYAGQFTVFRNAVDDFITFEFLGEDPNTGLMLSRFANIKAATLQGAEFELHAFLDPAWTAFGVASYTRGTDDSTGDPLPLIPPLKVVLGARYEHPRWWGELSTRIVARQDRIPPDTPADTYEETPGFTVFDLRAGTELGAGFHLQVAVDNLLDKAYHEPFNRRLESSRNVRTTVVYRF
ncbi:MAG: TonB-dependent receptor [Thermoanaerobaculaceae bacterium]|nr:TonB-dependent receptor [Thermoanaerobaculaceae bacterium]